MSLSPVNQVLVEKSVKGYQEIEFEVMRDKTDHAISICDMENFDPVGIHTGDSIVFAPCQTLQEEQFATLKTSALKIIRALKIEGGCNIQFALKPGTCEYFLIEVNPRVSRSSALASKATAYPIARVTAKIAVGLTLDEINISGISAAIPPAIDYIVAKMARFPFDKFGSASNHLSTQMKATGEVMSIGQSLEEILLKSVRGLEAGAGHPQKAKFTAMSAEELVTYITTPTDDRIFALCEALRKDVTVEEIATATAIMPQFVQVLKNVTDFEKVLCENTLDAELMLKAKRMGIGDEFIAQCTDKTEQEIFCLRRDMGVLPAYRIVDNCKHQQEYVPYFYTEYGGKNESVVTDKEKILVIGSGPIRIGQGVEFDYSTVHAVWAIKECGYEAIIINNNPETVSTDYTTADKLYFEPPTVEDVMNIIALEKPKGVIVTLGGQTAINLADGLTAHGINIIGTGTKSIELAENRDSFEHIMRSLNIPQPLGKAVTTIEDGVKVAADIGYPVLVRPSYVLGGRAMQLCHSEEELKRYLLTAVEVNTDQPVLVDRYIAGKELEVDAVCDGTDVLIPGIMEHVEETGVHSGDSMSVYPTFTVNDKIEKAIEEYTVKLGLGLGIVGLYNIQFIVDEHEDVYIIEVNPRSSRTVPFISKATNIPVAGIATRVMLGQSLKEQGYSTCVAAKSKRWYVKAPTFSFAKIHELDAVLSPEMKSTGEAIGYDSNINVALYKALQAAGTKVQNYGTVFATVADRDKEAAVPLIKRFYDLGFNIEGTCGTAEVLKNHGIKTRVRKKFSQGSDEIAQNIAQGFVTYVINTHSHVDDRNSVNDGYKIRRAAVENSVAIFTSLETVNVLLNVLESITLKVSTIDA